MYWFCVMFRYCVESGTTTMSKLNLVLRYFELLVDTLDKFFDTKVFDMDFLKNNCSVCSKSNRISNYHDHCVYNEESRYNHILF